MPKVALFDCTVRTPQKQYKFEVEVYRSSTPDEQKMAPAFYLEFVGAVHDGTHHEMMLVTSPVWGRVNPEVAIHVYTHPGSKERFVCYTGQVETLEHAKEFFQWWYFLLLHWSPQCSDRKSHV